MILMAGRNGNPDCKHVWLEVEGIRAVYCEKCGMVVYRDLSEKKEGK